MKHIFVRPAKAGEGEKVVKWSLSTPNNLFDPDVVTYPSTYTYCAFEGDNPLLYAAVQQPQMIEALAINPDADKIHVATALKELTQAVVTKAFEKGSGEIYFLCADDSTSKFARDQLFEEMPWKVYRLKLKDLEKPHENKNA